MIVFFNPLSARWKHRLPLSLLSVAAAVDGRHPYRLIDGNLEPRPSVAVADAIRETGARYLAVTVMPGPQLHQAVPLCREMKERFPELVTIWGGYFPSLHATTVLESGFVDYVVRGQGEEAFGELIDALEAGRGPSEVRNVSFRSAAGIIHNPSRPLKNPDELPAVHYPAVDVRPYIGPTWLGSRTLSYHSSFGCPFLCGFCAVASIYRGGWAGRSPAAVAQDLSRLSGEYGVNAIEFVDNNFFVGETRTREIADRLAPLGIGWWGEARPDTVMGYADSTWKAMASSGLRMMFFGVESSSLSTLRLMRKGGTQTPDVVVDLARRARAFGIVPEFSFVLGTPSDDVSAAIDRDIRYIRKIKETNPDSEIVIYVYSPVSYDDAPLLDRAKAQGFRFPARLEDWLGTEWQEHDLRKSPRAPWLSAEDLRKIRNFEWVLNARYPTVSDMGLRPWQASVMKALGAWRYTAQFYSAPYEIRVVANKLFRYRQPEVEGF